MSVELSDRPQTDTERRVEVLAALRDGPKSSVELAADVDFLRVLETARDIAIDPDRWPDEYVPGNPLVCRLPGDKRRWPGWGAWNV
jgi:hypothetical protein